MKKLILYSIQIHQTQFISKPSKFLFIFHPQKLGSKKNKNRKKKKKKKQKGIKRNQYKGIDILLAFLYGFWEAKQPIFIKKQ